MTMSSGTPGSLRALVLTLIGLPVVASACAGGKPQVPLPEDEVTRHDLPNGMWTVELRDPEPSDYPSCPGGNFCLVGAGTKAAAPAANPFDNCEASVEYPEGPDTTFGSRGVSVSFNDFWTRNERKAKGPKVCCYSWYDPCPGGRPLVDSDDVPLLAAARSVPSTALPADVARAAYWTEVARSEHASIASFARFSLELLALGAPASLVARAHRAALDEIAHTELALRLVERFGGRQVVLGELDVQASGSLAALTPEAVLRGTVRDGCVGETRAALDAEARGQRTEDPEERAAFDRIARDESAHATLAFDAVDWLVETFGADLASLAASVAERACAT